MFTLEKEVIIDKTGMKKAYSDTLCQMAREDAHVVLLNADLTRPSGMRDSFAAEFPDRHFNCGIQEANMVGVSCGLSAEGLIPFAHTFACFASRKCADQFFLTGCFARQNVKLIGSDPGFTAELNGASHAGLEDMGVYMGYPNVTLLDPCDPVEFSALLRIAKERYGMFYIRYNRKAVQRIYREGSEFSLDQANVLRDGKDVSLIASGPMVSETLTAAQLLHEQGIEARVVDLFCWKPIDRKCILKCALETGAIVTCENHNTSSGLGRAVAAVIAEEAPVPLGMIGAQDRFSQVGNLDFLKREYNMTAADIAKKAQEVIAKKR